MNANTGAAVICTWWMVDGQHVDEEWIIMTTEGRRGNESVGGLNCALARTACGGVHSPDSGSVCCRF